MSHNPPAPELLELTDRMGILVMDEVFDVWERKKTPLDFHLIFPGLARARPALDAASGSKSSVRHHVERRQRSRRAIHRRGTARAIANKLVSIVREEDPTRLDHDRDELGEAGHGSCPLPSMSSA